MSLYFKFSVRYSWNTLKTQNYYPDLIDFKYAPLTYTLWVWGSSWGTRTSERYPRASERYSERYSETRPLLNNGTNEDSPQNNCLCIIGSLLVLGIVLGGAFFLFSATGETNCFISLFQYSWFEMHRGLFVGPWVFSEDPFVWEENVGGPLVGPLVSIHA